MVEPTADETLIRKHFPNAFRETKLAQAIRGDDVAGLVICGAMSHMCIDATTRAAFDLGFKCTVVEDACTTRDLRFRGETVTAKAVHAAFMAALSVPYANVVSRKDCLASMRAWCNELWYLSA
ncbi:MAG: hypothetical protein BMS9Abin10_0133 [Gammaproteobacteria bacterium]|nr:MAG: hypothetical protein BMS9Abin10_0133 [Gammaproteobacteria bacterium]